MRKDEDLCRRLFATRHWRWVPGMACGWKNTEGEERVVSVNVSEKTYMIANLLNTALPIWEENAWTLSRFPHLSDPATLGCILALVREAWHSPALHTRLGVDGWEVRDTYTTVVDGKPTTIVCGLDWKSRGGAIDPNGAHGSEIEALVAALEAAQ